MEATSTAQEAVEYPPELAYPAPEHVVSLGGAAPHAVQVVPIYWGPNVWSAAVSGMSNFYNTLEFGTPNFMQILNSEYVPAGAETYPEAVFTITPQNHSTTLYETDIQSELAYQLSNTPNFPNNSADSYIYVVHLPPTVTAIFNGVALCSGLSGAACAYHDKLTVGSSNWAFALIPDFSSGPCSTAPNPPLNNAGWCNAPGSAPTSYNAMTIAESHEIAEAASDMDGSSGFKVRSNLDQGGQYFEEIADLCATESYPITDSSYGTFYVQPYWSNRANACVLGPAAAGDVDGDGYSDLVLTGGSGWATVPVAFSLAGTGTNGTFYGTNAGFISNTSPTFATLASGAGVKAIGGDFNGDGHADVALVGGSLTTIPVAVAATSAIPPNWRQGLGSATNGSDGGFHTYFQSGSIPVPGDFNGDGLTDIALVNSNLSTQIPVAIAHVNGSFTVTKFNDAGFHVYYQSGIQAVPGDFNCDGLADVALVGPTSWNTIPIAYAPQPGQTTVTVTNGPDSGLHSYFQPGVRAVSLPSCGAPAIGLVGPTGSVFPIAWEDLIVYGAGSFLLSAGSDMNFHEYYQGGYQVGTGDYNGDGFFDVVLAGGEYNGNPWSTMPVADTGWFLSDFISQVTNRGETSGDTGFSVYATQSGAQLVTGAP